MNNKNGIFFAFSLFTVIASRPMAPQTRLPLPDQTAFAHTNKPTLKELALIQACKKIESYIRNTAQNAFVPSTILAMDILEKLGGKNLFLDLGIKTQLIARHIQATSNRTRGATTAKRIHLTPHAEILGRLLEPEQLIAELIKEDRLIETELTEQQNQATENTNQQKVNSSKCCRNLFIKHTL